MLDGLWVGEWHSNVNNIRVGTGVVVFRQGKVFGGNDRFYFLGEYNLDGNRFVGDLRFTYYAGEPLSVFGLTDIDETEGMLMTGQVSGDEIKVEGTLKSNRKLKLHGKLHKKGGWEIF